MAGTFKELISLDRDKVDRGAQSEIQGNEREKHSSGRQEQREEQTVKMPALCTHAHYNEE